jgi:tetratricopeptide (TPR) repeat protein
VDESPREFQADRCGPGSLSLVLNVLGDPVSEDELDAQLPKASGGGVLSVDLLLAARQRGFNASLLPGTTEALEREIGAGRPAILLLRLFHGVGKRHEIFHYVVVDGYDPSRSLFRFQFGDRKFRWAQLGGLEESWKGAGHAMLLVRPRPDLDLREGVELEQAGRLDEAAAAYRRALDVDPHSLRGWVDLGNVEIGRGRPVEGENAYRRALEIDPASRDALNNLAWLLLESGTRLEEAEALALKAAERPGPDQPLAEDTLGRIWTAEGRCGDAVGLFGRAMARMEVCPGEARAQLLEALGEAERACGRLDEARAAFLEALGCGPDPKIRTAGEAALAALGQRSSPDPP